MTMSSLPTGTYAISQYGNAVLTDPTNPARSPERNSGRSKVKSRLSAAFGYLLPGPRLSPGWRL